MGGIIFMLAIIICVLGTYIYLRIKNETMVAHNLLPMVCLTMGFGVIGFIDDFKKLVLKNTKGLSPKAKMFGLLLISVAYTLSAILELSLKGTLFINYQFFLDASKSSVLPLILLKVMYKWLPLPLVKAISKKSEFNTSIFLLN